MARVQQHLYRAYLPGEAVRHSSTYFQRWLAASEELALKKGLVSAGELEQRAKQLAAEDDHD